VKVAQVKSAQQQNGKQLARLLDLLEAMKIRTAPGRAHAAKADG